MSSSTCSKKKIRNYFRTRGPAPKRSSKKKLQKRKRILRGKQKKGKKQTVRSVWSDGKGKGILKPSLELPKHAKGNTKLKQEGRNKGHT